MTNGVNGNIVGSDPKLGPLADNGGPTQTHALASDSLALDQIPTGTNGCGSTYTSDQRGATRPTDGDADSISICDMGAFELGGIQAAGEPATYTFLTDVDLSVTDDGANLDCLRVTDIPYNHPDADETNLDTGKYWILQALQTDKATAATADYSLDLTLPFTGAEAGDKLCRWGGSSWDCTTGGDHTIGTNEITRHNISALSDWTVRDNVPTAVTLASFAAAAQGNGIRLDWETATELDNLGFNVYRGAAEGERVRLNAALIPSQNPGGAAGAAYS